MTTKTKKAAGVISDYLLGETLKRGGISVVKVHRILQGITQAGLAKSIGMYKSSLSSLDSGEGGCHYTTAMALSKKLGLDYKATWSRNKSHPERRVLREIENREWDMLFAFLEKQTHKDLLLSIYSKKYRVEEKKDHPQYVEKNIRKLNRLIRKKREKNRVFKSRRTSSYTRMRERVMKYEKALDPVAKYLKSNSTSEDYLESYLHKFELE